MDFIKGNSRHQITFSKLESQLEENNPVRFADAFVEHPDLTQLEFLINTIKTEGRPSFHSFNYKLAT